MTAQKTVPTTGHTYTTTTTKATTAKAGSTVTKCKTCGAVKSNTTTTIPKIKSVKLSATSFTYNGKAQKPTVTVKDSKGKTLKEGTDYTVEYSKGCKNLGQYTVTVKFKDNYDGKKTLTFMIVLKGTSISKLTAGKKQFTANRKKSTQANGYEIQYSTSKKMKSAKTVTIGKAKTTSTSVKNLKSGKAYYVRIRTFKTVNGNKACSAWSKTATVKAK